ncbi:conserved hypothetical protein [Perkinsus marinus ATCC 50983]|uniref:Uncharacterized protein n=1 Tax=Perkinsus marinus (strain ATCC 50983 / TXsc) TaxID=423536 RepID=C5KTI5_PERM5|nr:conserved hypothetical protein [Perkinsus marinus ATCC 50983]EER12164.1 conserved hypothetical protein [Perkinsus marinus ATCC 50983]|eukprot:XP_002780369.1 conserved hypothetical protein [Perkinsus marinus ATCC 50983]
MAGFDESVVIPTICIGPFTSATTSSWPSWLLSVCLVAESSNLIICQVGTQGASVVRETISNKDLQDAAEATVRRMLEQILADESLRGVAGGWLMQLLNGMQNDIGDLMAKVIRLNAVQQAAKDLVAGLCKDPYIIQQVSSLVVSTIYMQVVQDAAAKWTGDLVIRPDVQEKLNQTTSDTLRSQMVYDTVQEVAIRVTQGVINDPATSEVLKERLTEVAADKELQAALSDSAWRVVSRSLNPFAKHPEITNGRDQSAEVIEDEEKDAVPSVEQATAIPSAESVNEPRASEEERITPEVHNEENVPSVEESPQVDATWKMLVVGDEGVGGGGGGLTTPVGEASVEPSEEQTPQEATPPQTLESDLDSQHRESVPSEEAAEVEVPFEVVEVEVPFSMSDADVETSAKPSVDATPEATSRPLPDMLIATAQKVRESYRKYRDRVREAKDTLMTRWRMRRKAREDDSERRLFSGALRRLSGEGEEEATKGDDQSSMQQQTADEGIPDREEPTICTADLAESTSIRSTPEESEVVVDTAREELATTAAGGTAFDKTGEETGDAARMEEPTTVGADGMSSTALDSVEVVAEITPDECATGTSAKQDDADSVDADSASTVEVPPPVDNGAAKTAVQQPGESYSSEQEGISMTSDEGTTTQQPSVTVLAVDDDLSTTSVASPEAKTVESVSEEFMEIGDPTGASISVVEDTHPIDEVLHRELPIKLNKKIQKLSVSATLMRPRWFTVITI